MLLGHLLRLGFLSIILAPGAVPCPRLVLFSFANQVSQATAQTLRLAFYADTPGALPSNCTLQKLDAIIPHWLSITSESGKAKIKMLERVSSDRVIRWLHWNAPTMAIYPEIISELSESDTLALLASTNRLLIIDGISNYLEENAFQGVTVRLVELSPSRSQSIFVSFLWELGEHLRARQMKLLPQASISSSVRRIREIREPSDYVILRALDNSPKSGPGPIAAQSWYEERLAAHFSIRELTRIILLVLLPREFRSAVIARNTLVSHRHDMEVWRHSAGCERITRSALNGASSATYGRPRFIWPIALVRDCRARVGRCSYCHQRQRKCDFEKVFR